MNQTRDLLDALLEKGEISRDQHSGLNLIGFSLGGKLEEEGEEE